MKSLSELNGLAPTKFDSRNGGKEITSDRIWDMLKEIMAYERHFNNLETEYRKLASVWLLACFAGLGFLLKENPQLGIPREVAMLAIGVATSVGILLLWILDLLVYHRLLDSCFREGKRLEGMYPELHLRKQMQEGRAHGKVTTWLRWFYIGLHGAPIIFSSLLFVVWLRQNYGTTNAVIAASALAIYLTLVSVIMWKWSLSKNVVQP